MKQNGTITINDAHHLEIGGVDVTILAKEYGTPLYVMDEGFIRDNCRLFKESFKRKGIDTEVIYASKAFCTMYMCRLIHEEGLSLDVVSGGELYTALKSGFPADKIYFHGNNKSNEELRMAIDAGIGHVIIDNIDEINRLERLCQEVNKKMVVLLRVNPGIEAHTHEYISTTHNDSKFGESIFSETIYDTIKRLKNSPSLIFKGLHYHIGSQIFDEASYFKSVEVALTFIKTVYQNTNIVIDELNLGGGFGIYYTDGDQPIEIENFLERYLKYIETLVNDLNLKMPKLYIEPGRAIVGRAGTTLYTIGSTKHTYGGKKYVFVDGGMGDHIRTALYGAEYEGVIANRMNDKPEKTYTVTGKSCESGDLIIQSIQLPTPKPGDILAVFSTGAYHYSMASNYNRIPRPAVVFVRDGRSKVAVKRESYEDLIRNDCI